MVNVLFAVCVALVAVYGVSRFWSLKMRTHASYTDLRALAKAYLSFSRKHDTGDRSQSFSEGGKAHQCLACVNFRDCGLVSPSLREGLIYRSSQVVKSSEIQKLQLGSVLDLRVLKKPCKKHAEDAYQVVKRTESRNGAASAGNTGLSTGSGSSDEETASTVSGLPLKWKPFCTVCPICTEDFGRQHGVDVPIYHSDLVPLTMKLRVFGKLPAKTMARAVGEICHLRNPQKMVAAAVVDPDVMGPTILYRLLLDHSKASIGKALRIFVRPENYPVLVHCIHGKDRTGLVIMLLLLLCDVPAKLVVADYIQSELQLKAGRDKGDLRELDDFLTSDNVIASKAETMVETIAHIERVYGSAKGYAKAVGLTDEEIASIRTLFMKQAAHTDLFDRFSSKLSHEAAQAFVRQRPSVAEEARWAAENPQAQSSRKALAAANGATAAESVFEGDVMAESEPTVCGGVSEIALEAASEAVEEVNTSLQRKWLDGRMSVEEVSRHPHLLEA